MKMAYLLQVTCGAVFAYLSLLKSIHISATTAITKLPQTWGLVVILQ